MTWKYGFNFRNTQGYVVDGADEVYVLGDVYPTTRSGVTFGWNIAPDVKADRDVTYPRIAGLNRKNSADTGNKDFRVDVADARYYHKIRIGVGSDPSAGVFEGFLDVRSALIGGAQVNNIIASVTIGGVNVAATDIIGVDGVVVSRAAWNAAPAEKTVRFIGVAANNSAQVRIQCGRIVAGQAGVVAVINHFYIEQTTVLVPVLYSSLRPWYTRIVQLGATQTRLSSLTAGQSRLSNFRAGVI